MSQGDVCQCGRGGSFGHTNRAARTPKAESDGGKDMTLGHHSEEPFFITEEVEAGLLAASYLFEPPLIACTMRQRDVLEGMSDAELALQSGEIADQERNHRQNKPFSAG